MGLPKMDGGGGSSGMACHQVERAVHIKAGPRFKSSQLWTEGEEGAGDLLVSLHGEGENWANSRRLAASASSRVRKERRGGANKHTACVENQITHPSWSHLT